MRWPSRLRWRSLWRRHAWRAAEADDDDDEADIGVLGDDRVPPDDADDWPDAELDHDAAIIMDSLEEIDSVDAALADVRLR